MASKIIANILKILCIWTQNQQHFGNSYEIFGFLIKTHWGIDISSSILLKILGFLLLLLSYTYISRNIARFFFSNIYYFGWKFLYSPPHDGTDYHCFLACGFSFVGRRILHLKIKDARKDGKNLKIARTRELQPKDPL